MGIFVDQDGHPIKFFLQKDLPENLQSLLKETIQAEGGRVESKVPIKGYILLSPGTAEAERLRSCWAAPDRPERHFVPFSWIDACKTAQMVLRQIFVHNGQPVKMCIHPSIANLNSREIISSRILHSGGDPTASEEEARVILADPETEVYEKLVKQYHGRPEKFVESHLWIKKCIDRSLYIHTPSTYRNPGGRRPGDERTAFTEDDESNLCAWIAAVIPYKESGGRTGNKIYQELVARAGDPGYEWVSRHTWQSWRERYKKNAQRLDHHIAAIVALNESTRGGKGQFGHFRVLSDTKIPPKAARGRRRKGDSSIINGSDAGASDIAPPSTSASAYNRSFDSLTEAGQSAAGNNGVATNIPDANKQESEDREWPIREGMAPPPEWAKRRAEETDMERAQKRLKTNPDVGYQFIPPTAVPPTALHPVDQAIHDIANEFHFLPLEVRAFYDRTGDMAATRDRFQRARAFIDTMP